MGGYLSQEEIDNLLQGVSSPDVSQKERQNSQQQLPDQHEGGLARNRADKNSPLVERVEFAPLQVRYPALGAGKPPLELFKNIALVLSGELGATEITVRDFLQLTEGSVIKLNKMAGESATILLNGQNFGQAEIVVINDYFGLRVTTIGAGENGAKKELPAEKESDPPGSDSPDPVSEEEAEEAVQVGQAEHVEHVEQAGQGE